MKKLVYGIFIIGILSESTIAHKLDAITGEIRLGGVINTGNSDNVNLNNKVELSYETKRWKNILKSDGQLNTASGVRTAERFGAGYESRFNLDERQYLFAKLGFTHDKFGTFDRVFRELIGYGRVLYRSPVQSLTVESGPGANHSRVSGTKVFEHFFIFNVSLNYERKISETTTFKQTVEIDFGQVNTHTEAFSSLKLKIYDNVAMELGYAVFSDSKIPPGSKNTRRTDTRTIIGVVYDFD